MTQDVEILSISDPPHYPHRVLYFTRFEGSESTPIGDYSAVAAFADGLVKKHDACLVDRSDKGTGLALLQWYNAAAARRAQRH